MSQQLDLFEWAAARPTAKIYDWCAPFAAKVMAHIHEYDDAWPKVDYGDNTVVPMCEQRRRA
jgi:hypothetical protein